MLGKAKDYEVGYGRPPSETQFKPGQSGNPKGRPKGRYRSVQSPFDEPFEDMVLDEAYRTITVNDGPKQKKMPMIQVVVRSVAVSAGKGNFKAQKLFADLVSRTEVKKREKLTQEFKDAMEIKARLEQELERREKNNLPSHDLLPHPDDIIIDLSSGLVEFWGPATKEDLHDLKALLEACRLQTEIVEDLFQTLSATTEKKEREEIIKTLSAPLLKQAELQAEIELRASPQCVRRILEEGA